jgi:hypothetical protein
VEVHPPHEPIHSIKEFLIHILAITIGLLIALGLEASVEWAHHRHLVREARENISQEIGDNQRNLARELEALPGEKKYLDRLLNAVIGMESSHPSALKGDFNWTMMRLSESSWNTAFSTGAIAHMSYDEAKRYSQLYALQELFNVTMDRYLQKRGEMYAFLKLTELPGKPSATEFESGKRTISEEAIMNEFLRELGTTLSSAYAKFPASPD